MKAEVLTSSFSLKSTTTTTTTTTASSSTSMDDNNNSCYFPGCRKDANCNCEICLASINATRDLMPSTSLTKLSPASKRPPQTPISFNPSILSTPRSRTNRVMVSPPLNSTARASFQEKIKMKKKELGIGFLVMRLVLGLSLIFSAEFGFSWVVSGILNPQLSKEKVRNLGEKSFQFRDLNGKFEFLQRELQGLINGKVPNCSSNDSVWEINQDNLLLNSRCILYKSAREELSIWGWPLQTAGLLTAEFSSRSFTILSGRVTEWSDGKLSYSTRKANDSWVQQKWSASVVQLDPNTWILEYEQTGVVENSKLVSSVLEFLKFRCSREIKRMKQQFWMFSAFGEHYSGFTEDKSKTPT